jgi:hypothetical protein
MKTINNIQQKIIGFPRNLSLFAVESAIAVFVSECLDKHQDANYVLRMNNERQLTIAGLRFIRGIHAKTKKAGRSMCIVDVCETVLNALRVAGIGRTMLVYRAMIDFEQEPGIALGVCESADTSVFLD